MDETTTVPSSLADETSNAPTPQAGNTTTSGSQEDQQQKSSSISLSDYEKIVKELRAENAKHRTSLKRFEEEQQKQDEARLSKEQLLEKQLADLQTQHQQITEAQFERNVNHMVAVEAAKAGVDPNVIDRVSRMLAWEDIEVDDEGTPSQTSVRSLIDQLLKDIPGLKQRGAASSVSSGGATNPSRAQTSAPSQLSWDVIGSLNATEYNARRSEIQEWIATHPPRYGRKLV
jgi:hypothetical protein